MKPPCCAESEERLGMELDGFKVGQIVHVSNYVSKADRTPALQVPVLLAELEFAASLAHLERKKHKLAAREFGDTNSEFGSILSDGTAAQDVATYGGVCALASFDGEELQGGVIDNGSNFNMGNL